MKHKLARRILHPLAILILITIVGCTDDTLVEQRDSSLAPALHESSAARRKLSTDAFQMRVSTASLYVSFTLFTEGSITVDWGDGTTETFHVSGSETSFYFEKEHEYSKSKIYSVSFTGDLNKVVDATFEGEPSSGKPWQAINLGALPVLASFVSYSDLSFQVLDFSSNLYIRSIILPAASVKKLTLGPEHNLTFIDLNGEKSNYDFDALIESIYFNAVEENILSGFLRLQNYGILSASSLEKLRILRDNYDWNIQV